MTMNKKAPEGTAIPNTGANKEQFYTGISEELLQEFISLREKFMPLYSETGLISIESSGGIHLKDADFLDTFQDYEVINRKDANYPTELYTTYNGVRFFCIR